MKRVLFPCVAYVAPGCCLRVLFSIAVPFASVTCLVAAGVSGRCTHSEEARVLQTHVQGMFTFLNALSVTFLMLLLFMIQCVY